MKNVFAVFAFVDVLSGASVISVYGQASVEPSEPPCNACDSSTESECSRTITPDGPHIFYGKFSPCGD